MTAKEAAEGLYGAMVHDVSTETLAEYGLAADEAGRAAIAEAVFELSLFWVHSAVTMIQQPAHARPIWAALQERITAGWTRTSPPSCAPAEFWREWADRRAVYEHLNRSGAGPHGVAVAAADRLIASGRFSDAQRHRLLALLLDLVPVDELGDLVSEIHLTA